MKGNTYCTIHMTPRRAERFTDVRLTCISNEGRVILSRGSKEDPEEILCVEAAQIDVLSAETIDIEGFVCTDEDTNTYHKCFVIFAPVSAEKEAA